MEDELRILKGIHPGFVLERKLKERNISKCRLALEIQEYPQTISAITKGKRNMNVPLSLKLEKSLNLEEGYFMILQAFYEIKKAKAKDSSIHSPDISKFRTSLFWDTDIRRIDWLRQKQQVLKRISERGNQLEIDEIQRFYASMNLQENQ